MLSKWATEPKKLVATLSASLLVLAGCTDTEERTERATDLASAAMQQINGRKVDRTDRRSSLERAKVDERAVAGTLRNDMTVRTASASSRYAVGSIVVKPVEVLEVPLAMVAAPELNEEELPPEPEMVMSDAPAPAAPRSGGRSRSLLPPPPQQQKAERRMKTRSLAQQERPRLRGLKVATAQKLEKVEWKSLAFPAVLRKTAQVRW